MDGLWEGFWFRHSLAILASGAVLWKGGEAVEAAPRKAADEAAEASKIGPRSLQNRAPRAKMASWRPPGSSWAAVGRHKRPEKRGQEQPKTGPRAPRSHFRPIWKPNPPKEEKDNGPAKWARPVKAYPGGFRQGKTRRNISNTLVTASGGRRSALQAHTAYPLGLGPALRRRLFGGWLSDCWVGWLVVDCC